MANIQKNRKLMVEQMGSIRKLLTEYGTMPPSKNGVDIDKYVLDFQIKVGTSSKVGSFTPNMDSHSGTVT